MKRIEKDDHSAIIFCDGSIRIEPKEKYLCFDLLDLNGLLMAAQQYRDATTGIEEQLLGPSEIETEADSIRN